MLQDILIFGFKKMGSTKILKRFKPLFIKGDKVFVSRGADVFAIEGKEKKIIFSFQIGGIKKILNKFKLFYRLKRSGVYSAIEYNGLSFYSYNRQIFSFDFNKNVLTKEVDLKKGNGPLEFSVIQGIDKFDEGVYFGEYFGNADKEEIHIYKRKDIGTWESVYTFSKGEINHIHALVPDRNQNCVWVLVGDFDDSAGIWKATDNFNKVERIVGGSQQFRSCVAFPVNEGLLYATDSQFEENHIRLLKKAAGRWESKAIFPMNGSSIYGAELKDYYVFSTSTEPRDEKSNLLLSLLDNKKGPGIIKNQSDVIICNKETLECKVLYSRKKDIFPYRLFQFGAIMFPKGKKIDNSLYAYNVGSKENDLSTEIWEV